MTEPMQDVQQVTLSTQAFLILCRLFDGCYDDMKQQESMQELVESIADILLAGVQELEGRETKPRTVTFPLTLPQSFLLRRLAHEMLARVPEGQEDNMTSWLQECVSALTGGAGAYGTPAT